MISTFCCCTKARPQDVQSYRLATGLYSWLLTDDLMKSDKYVRDDGALRSRVSSDDEGARSVSRKCMLLSYAALTIYPSSCGKFASSRHRLLQFCADWHTAVFCRAFTDKAKYDCAPCLQVRSGAPHFDCFLGVPLVVRHVQHSGLILPARALRSYWRVSCRPLPVGYVIYTIICSARFALCWRHEIHQVASQYENWRTLVIPLSSGHGTSSP